MVRGQLAIDIVLDLASDCPFQQLDPERDNQLR
jgi:hypothetical protein